MKVEVVTPEENMGDVIGDQKTAVRKPDLPPVFRYSPVKVEKKRLRNRC